MTFKISHMTSKCSNLTSIPTGFTLDSRRNPVGIESYHIPAGLQWDCRTLPRLQWESGSPPDSGGNTRGRVKYRKVGALWHSRCGSSRGSELRLLV